MNASRSKRTLLAVAMGGFLCLALFMLLNGAPPTSVADGDVLFVSPTGSGSACLQSDPCALQTALLDAWIEDTVFVAGGTYTGSGGAVITVTQNIYIRGGWDGAPSGPVVRDPHVYQSILDGENERRVVYIRGGLAPVLDGFVVTDGNATRGIDPRHGGGIYSSASSPVITNNVIRNNVAYSGTEWSYGGGIYIASASESTLIAGNTIVSNTANLSGSGIGGGVTMFYSDGTIRDNVFQGNVAGVVGNSQGGGLYLQASPVTIRHNVIQGNRSTPSGPGFGGAWHTQWGEITADGNIVIGNKSDYGAITFDGNARITMTNNLVVDNVGGVYADGTEAFPFAGTLAHNTIARNGPAGIYVGWYNWNHATLTLTNNIVCSHTTGIFVREAATNRVHAAHTLFYGNDADTGGGAITSTAPIVGLAPEFVNPAAADYHLQADSPAIDVGSPVSWLRTDIDGDLRPAEGGYDIGADEFVWRRVLLPLAAHRLQP